VLSVSADVEVTSFADGRRAAHGATPSKRASQGPTDLLRASLGLDSSTPYRGSGVGVAVVDSGIEPNRDLVSSIAGFWDFTIGSGVPVSAYDDYGHGTHVAGLIASDGIESHNQFAGIAPDVRLFGLKVLDRTGRGRVSSVLRALEWILANHHAKGIHVVNLSLGHPIYQDAAHDPLVMAVEKLVGAGLVVVVSAGNAGVDEKGDAGYAGVTSPANAPSALTVGAVDTNQTALHSDNRVAFFSSRGPTWFDAFAKPDIVAPGVALTSNAARFSELLRIYPGLRTRPNGNGNHFATLSGTSMAAAVTSGVVALLLDASRAGGNAVTTPNTIKALLQFTALPLRDAAGNTYDALSQGTGEINALGALAMIEALETAAPRGGSWIAPRPVMSTSIGGETIEWARRIIWDDTLVVDPEAIWVNSAQWGQCNPAVDPDCENIVWGTGFECGAADSNCENIVWGTFDTENIVWGTGMSWATSLVWPDRILGMFVDGENIVWGTFAGLNDENIVWGTFDGENIVWGTFDGENIVWGTFDGENIVWGTAGDVVDGENIVWGTIEATR
jgi:serine protease AprX